MEIEKVLISHNVSHVFKMYDDGECSGIAFKYPFDNQLLSFMLPMKPENILQVLKRKDISPKYQTLEQARRIGWRTIKMWIASQMSLIEIESVTFEQAFLPFIYDEKTGATFFDKVMDKGLLLE